MFAMTKKTGYGLIALYHLATLPPGQLASARQIASHYDIPGALLMNILKTLAAGGIVQSVRGARGGYRLDRQPDQVTFLQTIEQLEGAFRLAECMNEKQGDICSCRTRQACPIRPAMERLDQTFRRQLEDVTLQDLMNGTVQLDGLPVTQESSE
jgi:Rrf2 family protein